MDDLEYFKPVTIWARMLEWEVNLVSKARIADEIADLLKNS